ncbi:MAG: response regulator [Bacteroidota bacterium]
MKYFKKKNYICDAAGNYSQASEKIYLNEYDCVIVDITLPDGSGLDLIKELKEDKKQTKNYTILVNKSMITAFENREQAVYGH